MEKGHSDGERENLQLLPPLHRLLFLIASNLLYIPSDRQDSIYHGLCYISCGALAGMRNSSMNPRQGINLMTHRTMSECSTTSLILVIIPTVLASVLHLV